MMEAFLRQVHGSGGVPGGVEADRVEGFSTNLARAW
jgi:hypothetical protein